MKNEALFYEEQRFTQWWLWFVWIVLFGIAIGNFFELSFSVAHFIAVGSVVLETENLIPIIILILVLVLFRMLTLKTAITSDSIHIHYFPLFSKKWKWEAIQTAEVITYGFVGYGIRISFKYGMVYNVKGNKGLALHLKNGQKLVIGTQKPEELAQLFRGILK